MKKRLFASLLTFVLFFSTTVFAVDETAENNINIPEEILNNPTVISSTSNGLTLSGGCYSVNSYVEI